MKKAILGLLGIILTAALSGCIGPLVEIDDPSAMSKTAKEIPISDGPIPGTQNLGEVVGYSCKNQGWDPDPTIAVAADQIRIKARALGATAIASVRYKKMRTTLVPNCWSSIKATGEAVKLP